MGSMLETKDKFNFIGMLNFILMNGIVYKDVYANINHKEYIFNIFFIL